MNNRSLYSGLKQVNDFFDWLDHIWEGQRSTKLIGSVLVVIYLITLGLIALRRMVDAPVLAFLPTSYFYAIEVTFTFVLFDELVRLVFGLARSVSRSIAIQLEILSLILLRETFKKLSEFSEPLVWDEVSVELVSMVGDSIGALLIFVIVGVYHRTRQSQPFFDDEGEQSTFIAFKKLIALVLLVVFTLMGVDILIRTVTDQPGYVFFNSVYTILVFSAVLILLISLRYSMAFRVAFRNSAFAVTTVFILVSLVAPAPLNAFIGIGTALFALGLLMAYNYFATDMQKGEDENEPTITREQMQKDEVVSTENRDA